MVQIKRYFWNKGHSQVYWHFSTYGEFVKHHCIRSPQWQFHILRVAHISISQMRNIVQIWCSATAMSSSQFFPLSSKAVVTAWWRHFPQFCWIFARTCGPTDKCSNWRTDREKDVQTERQTDDCRQTVDIYIYIETETDVQTDRQKTDTGTSCETQLKKPHLLYICLLQCRFWNDRGKRNPAKCTKWLLVDKQIAGLTKSNQS